jgi:predicted Zn-dependent protease
MSYPVGGLFFFFLGQLHAHRFLKNPRDPLFKKMSPILGILAAVSMSLLAMGAIQTSWVHTKTKSKFTSAETAFFPTPSLIYNQAVASLKNSKPGKSYQTLKDLRVHSPHFHDSDYLIGLSLAREGKLEEATAELKKWLRIDPQHLHTYLLLSDILIERDLPKEARGILLQGIQCLPQSTQIKDALSHWDARFSSYTQDLSPPK